MYRDSARDLSLWNADPGIFKPTQDLIDLGKGFLPGNVLDRSVEDHGKRPRRWGLVAPLGLRYATIAMAVVVLLTGTMWLGRSHLGDASSLDAVITNPVAAAIEVVSARGPIVLPGGENSLAEKPQAYRSASGAVNDSLSASLAHLLKMYQGGDTSRDVSYWLVAGLLASGQVDAARDYGRQALVEHPKDNAIVTLVALVAYSASDYDESQRLLDRVIQRDPDNAVALINLGIVLLEEGEAERARRIFEQIRTQYPDAPLAHRAESLLLTMKP
ncbi:MAG: tetratricopeptide repeat protein [Candidatus Latescibacterota bacterium]